MVMANTMADDWLARLRADYPDQPLSVCHSVVRWLLGASLNGWRNYRQSSWV